MHACDAWGTEMTITPPGASNAFMRDSVVHGSAQVLEHVGRDDRVERLAFDLRRSNRRRSRFARDHLDRSAAGGRGSPSRRLERGDAVLLRPKHARDRTRARRRSRARALVATDHPSDARGRGVARGIDVVVVESDRSSFTRTSERPLAYRRPCSHVLRSPREPQTATRRKPLSGDRS